MIAYDKHRFLELDQRNRQTRKTTVEPTTTYTFSAARYLSAGFFSFVSN